MAGVFDGKVGDRDRGRELEVRELHVKIGQLVIERDLYEGVTCQGAAGLGSAPLLARLDVAKH